MSDFVFLGPKMNHCRNATGLSVQNMATLLGIDKDEYLNYECNEKVPPLDLLFRFSRCFEVLMEDLVDDEENIILFEKVYDYFHFAKFREKYLFYLKAFTENPEYRTLTAEDFIKKMDLEAEKALIKQRILNEEE